MILTRTRQCENTPDGGGFIWTIMLYFMAKSDLNETFSFLPEIWMNVMMMMSGHSCRYTAGSIYGLYYSSIKEWSLKSKRMPHGSIFSCVVQSRRLKLHTFQTSKWCISVIFEHKNCSLERGMCWFIVSSNFKSSKFPMQCETIECKEGKASTKLQEHHFFSWAVSVHIKCKQKTKSYLQ